jgi:predicted nucleic acid-binding protein
MILVNTSVWIEHFRAGSERLKALLLDGQVLCHPFVVGELACGTLQKRSEILRMLKALPEVHLLEPEEVQTFLNPGAYTGVGSVGWTLIF